MRPGGLCGARQQGEATGEETVSWSGPVVCCTRRRGPVYWRSWRERIEGRARSYCGRVAMRPQVICDAWLREGIQESEWWLKRPWKRMAMRGAAWRGGGCAPWGPFAAALLVSRRAAGLRPGP
ncbi:hypothetical protein NDU88_001246 [Pleurodeles waltl]|uniref:Uncharacterized protein n=1 Tax=Pleurodeles waltl TaxID=8319 RepID=A0AAV7VVV2_PLEWA|nr:hypothetical protein NDU88_001246 [Pleurodeles waltl]